MFKKLIFLTAACSFTLLGYSQQDPQFSMNMNNRLYVNPATAGANDALCGYILGRHQWAGFEGRPETYIFGVHSPFTIPGIELSSGGGLSIMTDGLGQERTFGIKGSYAARFKLNIIGSDPGMLSVGVGLGLLQKSLGTNWRSTNPYFSDPTIPDAGFTKGGFDLDFGLYYQTEKGLYVGISATHLTQTAFEESGLGLGGGFEDNDQVLDWNTKYVMVPHYYLMAGYDIPWPSNPLFVLKPSIFVKSESYSTQLDVNVNVEWNSFLWGGLSYRMIDAAVVMAGVNYEPVAIMPGTLRFGYAYDINTSRINDGSNGSHELFLQYCLKLKKPAPVQKHKTVRFL